MKKNRKKILRFRSLFLTFIFAITIIASSVFIKFDNVAASHEINNKLLADDSAEEESDLLEIKKTVTKKEGSEDEYTITLEADGEPVQEKQKKADIILVVDKSTSMLDKIEEVKKSLHDFCETIRNTNADIRICLVQFGKDASNDDYVPINEMVNGGSEKYAIDRDIDNIIIYEDTGTNTQAGIIKVGEMLGKARADSQKYVVLFTDGLPTYSYNYKYEDQYEYHWFGRTHKSRSIDYNNFFSKYSGFGYAGTGADTTYNVNYKAAEIEYNRIIGGIKEIGESGADNSRTDRYWDYYTPGIINFDDIKDKVTLNHYNASFYSIGVVTDEISEDEKVLAQSFLSKINSKGYKYGENVDDVSTFYDQIAKEISSKINDTIASNVIITDKLTQYFDVCEDMNIQGIDKDKANIDKDDNKNIIFDIGDMKNKISISFDVKVNNKYFSGNDVPTNAEAKIHYTDPSSDKNEYQIYNVPVVTIQPLKGIIHVIKQVNKVDKDGNILEQNIQNDDNFLVNIKNDKNSYSLNACSKQQQNLEFYLKDDKTILDHIYYNQNESIGYVNAGEYNIEELLKMKYTLSEIQYTYNKDGKDYKKLESGITIDKDHPVIYIKIINNYCDSNAWTDDQERSNEFNYPKPIR